jgi:hypothetical protein
MKLILQCQLTSRYVVTLQLLNPQSSGTLSDSRTELTSCEPNIEHAVGFIVNLITTVLSATIPQPKSLKHF